MIKLFSRHVQEKYSKAFDEHPQEHIILDCSYSATSESYFSLQPFSTFDA